MTARYTVRFRRIKTLNPNPWKTIGQMWAHNERGLEAAQVQAEKMNKAFEENEYRVFDYDGVSTFKEMKQ